MEFYHVLNRGVDKRVVFNNKQDYVRFERNLQLLNTSDDAPTNDWTIRKRMLAKAQNKLVTIHAYCLMPNHYHLLLSPLTDNGISLFMKKINMGYARYFNEQNDRSGSLWQGKYKSILIDNQAHLNYIPFYIHLNALDLTLPQWREGKASSFKKAMDHLNAYRWSSHEKFLDPSHALNSIVQDSFFIKHQKNQTIYLDEIKNIINSKELASGSTIIE